MKLKADDSESEGSLKAELARDNDSPLTTTIPREDHEQAINKVKAELSATKRQCEDLLRQLAKKEEEEDDTKQEVETLKKMMNHSTSMAVSVQRDHAVAAVTEKDIILQNYRRTIDGLNAELKQTRKQEETTVQALHNEIKVLRESLVARKLNKEAALDPSNMPPADSISSREDVENRSPSFTGGDVPAEKNGGVTRELEVLKVGQYQLFRV